MPSSACRPQAAQFIPIRCIFFNKLTQDDKLVLAFDASVLAQVLGRDIPVGKIIHGDLRHCIHCSRREEAPSENAVRGSTGDSPVPSGDPPDGTAAMVRCNDDGPSTNVFPPVPVGGSPTGAGEPPALPILQTNSPDGIDDPKTGTSAAPTNRPLIPSFSPDGGEGARRADEGDAAKLEDAIREFESCDLSRVQPRVTKVKTSALAGEVRKRLEQIAALLSHRTDTRSADSLVRESDPDGDDTRGLGGPRSGPSPPDLVLNRRCAECEFQARCRQKAIETDDLSLLAGISAMERQKLRSKGIFTVTQLSYTFRPRRRPKRLRDKREKYHHALKALAIREKKIHIVGRPDWRFPAKELLGNADLRISGMHLQAHSESSYPIRVMSANMKAAEFVVASDPDEELTSALERVQRSYGSDLASFFEHIRRKGHDQPGLFDSDDAGCTYPTAALARCANQ